MTTPQATTFQRLAPYCKLALTSFLFGGIFIAGRMIAGNVHPAVTALSRFFIATLILLSILLFKEKRLPVPVGRQWLLLTVLGLTGVAGYNLLLLTGLETVSPGRSSVIVATNPLFIMIIYILFFGEKLTLYKSLGILLSVSGAMLVTSRGNWHTLIDCSYGDLAVLFCAVCWALYSVVGQRALQLMTPLMTVTWASILGLIILLPITLLSADITAIAHIDPTTWLTIIYMGVFGTACAFLLYYEGIQAVGVVQAGAFINLIPVSTIILALLILDEQADLSIILGTIMTISGIFLVNSQKKASF